MAGETDNFDYNSDEEVNSKDHTRLVDAICLLDKTQYIKKATRSEPSLQTSEFHLVKTGGIKESAVSVTDLVKVLGKTAKHADIGKKLTTAQRKVRTLDKPLEKPQAERIQRSIGFENAKKQLGRWDAIVAKNRSADHQSFPLKQVEVKLTPSTEFLSKFRLKSDLEKELEALHPKKESEEKPDEFPLTLEEIMERRKETAKLRAQQSYRESKARRQSKIKSKKYHRIQRREKIKQQLKNFEQLQKTDPEAALAQLELLERSRAEERASLRHKSTGKWANNLQVRAKYDKDSRKELAQQLAISRDLTQKLEINNSDTESDRENEEVLEQQTQDVSNPWVKPQKTSAEIDNFVSGYRKYWEQRNSNNQNKEEYDSMNVSGIVNDADVKHSQKNKSVEENTLESTCRENVENNAVIEEYYIDVDKKQAEAINKKRLVDMDKTSLEKMKIPKKAHNICVIDRKNKPSKNMDELDDLSSAVLSIHKDVETSMCTSKWYVTDMAENKIITKKVKNTNKVLQPLEFEKMFEHMEDSVHNLLNQKVKKLKKDLNIVDESNKLLPQLNSESEDEYTADLSFKTKKNRPQIDEEMIEMSAGKKKDVNNMNINKLKKLSKISEMVDNKQNDKQMGDSIDPNKFVAMKAKHLLTALPDMITGDEDLDDTEETGNRKMTIAEAFEEDDIVAEFQKDKEDEVKKDRPEDIDLTLPGWGSWGGKNLSIPKWKRRRLILKFPKIMPRRDDNKGDVIIKENADVKLKPHMVSELPFPFTSVKDFEASVRAPIGTTFVPETAHRRLTAPAVKTKMGAIIEPMDDDMLINKKKKR